MEGTEPSPSEQVVLCDCYCHYLNCLPENLRDFAELHLAGLTNKEIAARTDCVERTVERKLALVRKKWREMAAESLTGNKT